MLSKHYALAVVLLASIGEPTPSPAPVGDAFTPPAHIAPPGAAQSAASPTPSTSPAGVPDVALNVPEALFEAGQVTIIVRACIDDNGDRRCTLGEELEGLPVAVLDAVTGDVHAHVNTDASGRAALLLTLPDRARLSVDSPFVGFSAIAWPAQRSIELALEAPALPAQLPTQRGNQ